MLSPAEGRELLEAKASANSQRTWRLVETGTAVEDEYQVWAQNKKGQRAIKVGHVSNGATLA